MSNEYLIGCIPLRVRDTPPPEQSNAWARPCGQCGDLMWVSEKKRDFIKNTILKTKLWCFDCIIKTYPKEAARSKPVDISEIY